MRVYFVGAGPGDPELITVRGHNLITQADVIIYAGSLVNPRLLDERKESCTIYDSASMSLEEVVRIYEEHISKDSVIVRLHSGDPSLYGAIKEQIDWLRENSEGNSVSIEVVPGVSSFAAASAALQSELTLPEVSQTVIISRMAGRTPVPEGQTISELAEHKATICVFLSVHMIDKLVEELLKGYDKDTPVAVVERASWPDQRIIKGNLGTIAEKVKDAEISKTAMIIVGNVLTADYERSKLYDPEFTHMYRGTQE